MAEPWHQRLVSHLPSRIKYPEQVQLTLLERSQHDGSQRILDVSDVRKKYGKFVALDTISFSISKGNHLLVLGPNGAGKTTLIKCIMDLIKFEGDIEVGGTNVRHDARAAKKLIGYVPQNYAFYENLTVGEHARLSIRLKEVGTEEMKEKLETVDLWYARDRKVKALSDGMKQRLGIALALIGDPPLLLLDEPTSNVDLRGQLEFQSLMQGLLKEGKSFLTTTHLTGLGELANQVLVLDKGKLIANGSPSELLGKMNVTDTLYIRVAEGEKQMVIDLLKSEGASEVIARSEWITALIPSEVKVKVLKGLLESGYKIADLMIERSKIESEYLKLIGDNGLK